MLLLIPKYLIIYIPKYQEILKNIQKTLDHLSLFVGEGNFTNRNYFRHC